MIVDGQYFFLKYLFYLACMCIYLKACMCHQKTRSEEVSGPLELEFLTAMSHLVGAGNQSASSMRLEAILNLHGLCPSLADDTLNLAGQLSIVIVFFFFFQK